MVRVTDDTLGIDDWLIVAGLVVYIADSGLAVHAVKVGIGSKDDHLNTWMHSEAQKLYTIWITVYVVTVALIKTSVCVTLRRIAANASIATVARAPFISHYKRPTDNLKYYICYIVLFSFVEIGIGCIATSLPSLRILYKRVRGQEPQGSTGTPNANTLITIGGGKIGDSSSRGPKRVFTNPTDRGITSTHVNRGDNDWERLSDEDSDKGILVTEVRRKALPQGGDED
ncbi:hypothetical protein LZL87_012382 [Fusarium oxysporum]|nr:hypothetical protein LZL87_012382 [Fusarium oxysporum]